MLPKLSAFNWRSLLLSDKSLNPHSKYLGLYLATFMNAHNEMAWPSQSRMSHETGLSISTVKKYLKELETASWLITKRKAKHIQTAGGLQACNQYWINIPEKVVAEATELLKGGSCDHQRGVVTGQKGGREPATNSNIITTNNKKTFSKKTGRSKPDFSSYPDGIDPSRFCKAGESEQACKSRAWRIK